MMRKRAAVNRNKAERLGAISEIAAEREVIDDWNAPDIPLRLQQWAQLAQRDVSNRIFRDLVVRLPFRRSSPEEVIALLEPFGEVRYLQCAAESNEKGPSKSAGGAAALGVGGELTDEENSSLCHLVRFEDGMDAIRAFLHINGAIIDPQKQRDVACELYDAIQVEAARLGDDMTEEDREIARLVSDSLKPGDLIENADTNNRLVVITVDFFRVAVLEGGPTIPRMSLLSNAKRATRVSFADHHRWLQKQAAELDKLHAIVVSHGLAWQDFAFTMNYAMFMLGTPSGAPWATAAAAMRAVDYKHRRVTQWIDKARGEADLLTGDPNVAARKMGKRSLFPLSVPARLFLAVIVLVTLLLVWLRFTRLI